MAWSTGLAKTGLQKNISQGDKNDVDSEGLMTILCLGLFGIPVNSGAMESYFLKASESVKSRNTPVSVYYADTALHQLGILVKSERPVLTALPSANTVHSPSPIIQTG